MSVIDNVAIMRKLNRIENLIEASLSQRVPEVKPTRLPEKKITEMYGVSKHVLKRMRLGYTERGKWHDPVLFHWGHVNGRRIDYDVKEFESVFKRTIL